MKYYLAYIILLICLSSCANPIVEIPKEESKNLDKIKTVETENRRSYQPDSAKFQNFVKNFSLLEEFTIDQKLLQATSKLQPIKPEDVFDFIYQVDEADYGKKIVTEYLPLFENSTNGLITNYLPKEAIENGTIQFYYFGKLNLLDGVNSLIFAIHDTLTNDKVYPIQFMLFNYHPNGKIIDDACHYIARVECYMALTFSEVSYAEKEFRFLEMRYEGLPHVFNYSTWGEDFMFKCCSSNNESEPYYFSGYSLNSKKCKLSEDAKKWIEIDQDPPFPFFNKTYVSKSRKDSISFVDDFNLISLGEHETMLYKWDFEKGNFIYRYYGFIWGEDYKISSFNEAELKFDGTFDSFTLKKNGKTEVYYLLKD